MDWFLTQTQKVDIVWSSDPPVICIIEYSTELPLPHYMRLVLSSVNMCTENVGRNGGK